jgi:uncharacterized FAD-dependent dehydrogenase
MTEASVGSVHRCDALILGSGPAGLFAAEHLLRAGVRDVVIVEKGHPMARRVCPEGPACDCRLCDVLEGEGGAGSFSDGKITLSPTRGTHGRDLFRSHQAELLDEVGATLRRFTTVAVDHSPVDSLTALDGHEGELRGESYPLLHVGSDGVREFGHRYSTYLQDSGVRLLTGVEATEIRIHDAAVTGVTVRERRTGHQYVIDAGVVIVAVGMTGTPWLEEQLRRHGIRLETGPADFGIRLETRAAILAPLIDDFYDFKVAHTSPAGITLRSFCVNGNGYIVNEYHRALGVRGVNGHSFLDRHSGLSNLAILATIDRQHTDDPKAFVRDLARRVNAGADGYPVRQTLAEFNPHITTREPIGVEASNPKTRPARLDQLLPSVLVDAFTSYITALGSALPALLAPDTVLYAPEIKYYNYQVPIDPATWESTDIGGLFVVGNAAGYTASLSAAALTGVIAGQAAAHRLHDPATTPKALPR